MALTATKDLMLPATVTGSWPRPTWFTQSLWGKPLDSAMLDLVYREQLTDALAVVVSDQERAGLDLVTNGDYFLDPTSPGARGTTTRCSAGRGWSSTSCSPRARRRTGAPTTAGTLLHEIHTSWRWPIVTGKIEHNPRNPLEYAKLWRLTQARTRKPVKFGTVSAQVMALFLDSHTRPSTRSTTTSAR